MQLRNQSVSWSNGDKVNLVLETRIFEGEIQKSYTWNFDMYLLTVTNAANDPS